MHLVNILLFYQKYQRLYRLKIGIWLLRHCMITRSKTVWHYKPITLTWFVPAVLFLFWPSQPCQLLVSFVIFVLHFLYNLSPLCSFQSDPWWPKQTWLTLTTEDDISSKPFALANECPLTSATGCFKLYPPLKVHVIVKICSKITRQKSFIHVRVFK